MENVSIIVTHWAMSNQRSEVMRRSMESLIKTAPSAEIIVVDNGGSESDSRYLLELNEQGKIACYIRNRKNMHFAYARNQGIKVSNGDYLVIADNDIEYRAGWLEDCIAWLKANPGKYFATPLECDPINRKPSRWQGEKGGWRLNMRAGSNCTVASRENFNAIGYYKIHRIAGSKWTDTYVKAGYLMAVMPIPKAIDLGFREGYNLNLDVEHLIP